MGTGFRPRMRIRRPAEIQRVLRAGRKQQSRHFSLHLLKRDGDTPRLGIVASRRVGNAVERNRAKRLIREAFRRISPDLPSGLDLVVVAKRLIVGAKLKDVEETLRGAVGRGDR